MPHDDLWSFACRCYAQPGVEAACLDLQAAGADVCLWLTGAWLERRRVGFSEPRLASLQAFSQYWQGEVVAPLRALRRDWRSGAEADAELAAIRTQVKRLELDAEAIELRRLQELAGQWQPTEAFTDWLGPLSIGLAVPDHPALSVLREAAQREDSCID
ncbi:TIGR02444 family protein [Pseudomonas sp.]|uniref:TIGR02444 family protein n=1 Tax=Pseudomonas sp. TaxID=306 RepID=UPI0028A98BCB|nr:TIGR02444 family protein [Pseudomonas sp.]